jgi:hypothetical protein
MRGEEIFVQPLWQTLEGMLCRCDVGRMEKSFQFHLLTSNIKAGMM